MPNLIYVDGHLLNIQDPAVKALMERIYNDAQAGRPIPELVCDKPHRGSMYLQMRPAAGGAGKQLWANHKPGHAHPGCANLRISEGPAHLNAKDYTATALQRHGFTVETEHSTGNGTILDVAVLDSPTKLGLEAQFYPMKERDLRTRTTKSFNGGFTTAWMPGSNQLAQSMGYSVPMLRPHTDIDWAAGTPRLGTVHVLSKRVMTIEPCTPSGPFTTCPETGRGVCGKWHPFFGVADTGFQVLDEVLGEMAGALTVPLMDARGVVWLVSAEDRSRYEEHTGLSGEYRAASEKPERVTPPARLVDVECRADRTPVEASPSSPVLRSPAPPITVTYRAVDDDYCAFTWSYNETVLQAFKSAVPQRYRRWDKTTRQWCVHRVYVQTVAAKLTRLGCRVQEIIPTPAPMTVQRELSGVRNQTPEPEPVDDDQSTTIAAELPATVLPDKPKPVRGQPAVCAINGCYGITSPGRVSCPACMNARRRNRAAA